MVVATPPPPPNFRPEDIAIRMERMLNKMAEDSHASPGLYSRVRYLPDEPHEEGEYVFEVSVNGEGYGGPMAVKKAVPQARFRDWAWAENPFLMASSDVLRRLQYRLTAERLAQDEEE